MLQNGDSIGITLAESPLMRRKNNDSDKTKKYQDRVTVCL